MNNEQYEATCAKTWFKLLVEGVSKLYTSNEALHNYISLLEGEGFDTYYFNCDEWKSVEAFSEDYMNRLSKNDLESSILPDGEGYVFVFQNFEEYFAMDFEASISFINIIQELSRQYLLFGKKLIVFLNAEGNTINKKLLETDNVILMTPMEIIDDNF